MKKFFAAVCCTLLVASVSFAQSATRVAPAAEAMQAVSDAAAAVTQAPVEAAPVMGAPAAAPMTSGVVEGTVVNSPMAPTATLTQWRHPTQWLPRSNRAVAVVVPLVHLS